MEKLFFKDSFKSVSHVGRTKAEPDRNRTDVSSRWNEVSGRGENSPENPEKKVDRKKGEKSERSFGGLFGGSKKLGALNENFNETDSFDFDGDNVGSPFELFNKIEESRTSISKGKNTSNSGEFSEDVALVSIGNKKKTNKDVNTSLPIQENVVYMNPMAGSNDSVAVDTTPEVVMTAKPVVYIPDVEELVNKIVKEVSLMTTDGRTETTIQIKNSSLFSGAQVTITEFDSAKKQYNIKFENLTQRAHEIVSMQQNREALKSALEQKGYNIHIITATTEIEKVEPSFKSDQERNGNDKREQQPQQDQQKKQR